jgi:hypothetical protein
LRDFRDETLMQDWNIRSRAHECCECQQGFKDKQSYRTLLFHGEEEFERLDLCNSCWEKNHQDDHKKRDGFLSVWKGTYKAPPPPAPDAIQKDTAESLLRKLVDLNDPQYLAASYILAVMLERKRIIKVKDQAQENGRRVFIYEHPKNGDVFSIPDPALKLDELASVQSQVADLMENGLPGERTNDLECPEQVEPEDGESQPEDGTENDAEPAALGTE